LLAVRSPHRWLVRSRLRAVRDAFSGPTFTARDDIAPRVAAWWKATSSVNLWGALRPTRRRSATLAGKTLASITTLPYSGPR